MRKRIINYSIVLVICIGGCERDRPDFLKEVGDTILIAYPNVTEIEADGASKIKITAILPTDVDRKTLEFVTSHGRFADSTAKRYVVEAIFRNDTLLGTAYLTSSLEVNPDVQVKVSAKAIDKYFSVSFTRAFPEEINIESSVATIKAGFGSEVPLQTFLTRSKGLPSLHHIVAFEAITEDTVHLGEFRAIDQFGSNDKGVVNSIYVMKDTSYTGILRIIATTNTKFEPVRDTLKIFVTK